MRIYASRALARFNEYHDILALDGHIDDLIHELLEQGGDISTTKIQMGPASGVTTYYPNALVVSMEKK